MSRFRDLIGNNLRYFRRLKDVNQSDLAAKSEISQKTVSAIELGQTNATIDNLEALAKALGIDVIQLFKPGGELDLGSDANSPLLDVRQNPIDATRFLARFLQISPTMQKIVLALVFEDDRYVEGLPLHIRQSFGQGSKDPTQPS